MYTLLSHIKPSYNNALRNKNRYTPGKVLHIVTKDKATCCNQSCGCMNFSCSQGNVFGLNKTCMWHCVCGLCVTQPTYTARWVSRETLQEIVVAGTVMDDHLPNKCEIAIRSALSTCMDSQNNVSSLAVASSPLAVSIRVRAEEKEEEKKEEE